MRYHSGGPREAGAHADSGGPMGIPRQCRPGWRPAGSAKAHGQLRPPPRRGNPYGARWSPRAKPLRRAPDDPRPLVTVHDQDDRVDDQSGCGGGRAEGACHERDDRRGHSKCNGTGAPAPDADPGDDERDRQPRQGAGGRGTGRPWTASSWRRDSHRGPVSRERRRLAERDYRAALLSRRQPAGARASARCVPHRAARSASPATRWVCRSTRKLSGSSTSVKPR